VRDGVAARNGVAVRDGVFVIGMREGVAVRDGVDMCEWLLLRHPWVGVYRCE
jgi:hypothetical protein